MNLLIVSNCRFMCSYFSSKYKLTRDVQYHGALYEYPVAIDPLVFIDQSVCG